MRGINCQGLKALIVTGQRQLKTDIDGPWTTRVTCYADILSTSVHPTD